MALKRDIATELGAARSRMEDLLAPLSDQQMAEPHDPIMSPLVWDYAHIGVYEELWLIQQIAHRDPIDEQWMHVYDAFETPRAVRGTIELMTREQARQYRDEVRARALDILDHLAPNNGNPLLENSFVYSMVAQHEAQHTETALQTLQLMEPGYCPELPVLPPGREVQHGMVQVAAGDYPIGNCIHIPYDNERGQFTVHLDDYFIDRFPATCGQFSTFIDDHGYDRTELWSDKGRQWRQENPNTTAPKYWIRDGDSWRVNCFGHMIPINPNVPVTHICYYEAEAFARWSGKRLPSEYEWEVAATWDPHTQTKRTYPWGDHSPDQTNTNIGQTMFRPAPIGAYPQGASALGCEQMIGDVWEWTSSDFQAYPGFDPFPYKEYSEVFFGPLYKVLRGASWAAQGTVARATFRNWDFPIRRQIFSGFRCAANGDTR